MSVSIQADVGGTSGTVKVNSNTAFTFDSAGVLNATTVQHNGVATERISLGTSVSATGSVVDFTGIPSWAKKITVMFSQVGTPNSYDIRVQLFANGSLVTSGYTTTACYIPNGVSPITATHSTGVWVIGSSTNTFVNGACVLNKFSGNTWVSSGVVQRLNDSACQISAGQAPLAGVLTGVRVEAVSGSFDAGSVNILIEG